MQRLETEHADEIAKAKEKQEGKEEKDDKKKKKKGKDNGDGKDGKEDATSKEENKEKTPDEGKDAKKEEKEKGSKKDVPAVFNEEPRIFSLKKSFFQMRIDRIRNAELAKRNMDRLQAPGAFPSVPSGTL